MADPGFSRRGYQAERGCQPIVWPKFAANYMKMKKIVPRRACKNLLCPSKTEKDTDTPYFVRKRKCKGMSTLDDLVKYSFKWDFGMEWINKTNCRTNNTRSTRYSLRKMEGTVASKSSDITSNNWKTGLNVVALVNRF